MKSQSNPNLPYMMLKKKVFFSLCKYQPWNKNIKNRVEFNFRCLAPQLILRFFHFCRGFFLCLWQLCSLLCRPPQRSKRSKLKKKCLQWVTFPGQSWSIVITPGGSVVLLVCGFRRRDNRDLEQSGRQRQGRLRLKNLIRISKMAAWFTVSYGATPQLRHNVEKKRWVSNGN